MIAGLEEISGGELRMDGKLMNYVEPQKREIAMVFQNYALYPHYDCVRKYGLRAENPEGSEKRDR